MVNWRRWELIDLFQDPNNLPAFLDISLPGISIEERLHLFELLHPVHRLLDFWCGHSNQTPAWSPISDWQLSDWQAAQVHLHPQLKTTQVREELITCVTRQRSFEISRFLNASAGVDVPLLLDSTIATCLLPLWDSPQSFTSLVERWLQVRPVNPVTLEPVSEASALNELKQLLSQLEVFLYVLLETSP
jgi:hypothetical protein